LLKLIQLVKGVLWVVNSNSGFWCLRIEIFSLLLGIILEVSQLVQGLSIEDFVLFFLFLLFGDEHFFEILKSFIKRLFQVAILIFQVFVNLTEFLMKWTYLTLNVRNALFLMLQKISVFLQRLK